MLLELFGFMGMTFTDILDIFLVGLLITVLWKWIKDSPAMNLFLAILFIYALMLVVDAFHMKLMTRIIGIFMDVGVIALVVIFQPEIRHFLMRLGVEAHGVPLINKFFGGDEREMDNNSVNEITEACNRMSADKTGVLIVIPGKVSLEHIVETGDRLDAKVSRRLLMNLFFKNSPLHDGAVIISGDRIVAARCTLPITDKKDIPAQYGMRHKAAVGISENTDAKVIVVSEETGGISFVEKGLVTAIGNINELKLRLRAEFSGDGDRKGRHRPARQA